MLDRGAVIEHGQTRRDRWLRERRVRIAGLIALVEAVLLVFHVLPWLLTLLVAILIVVGYFWLGERIRSRPLREAGWIAAVSQALVMLVPVLLILIGTLALIALAGVAVAALVVLFSRHR
jgi:hypothetical protein